MIIEPFIACFKRLKSIGLLFIDYYPSLPHPVGKCEQLCYQIFFFLVVFRLIFSTLGVLLESREVEIARPVERRLLKGNRIYSGKSFGFIPCSSLKNTERARPKRAVSLTAASMGDH